MSSPLLLVSFPPSRPDFFYPAFCVLPGILSWSWFFCSCNLLRYSVLSLRSRIIFRLFLDYHDSSWQSPHILYLRTMRPSHPQEGTPSFLGGKRSGCSGVRDGRLQQIPVKESNDLSAPRIAGKFTLRLKSFIRRFVNLFRVLSPSIKVTPKKRFLAVLRRRFPPVGFLFSPEASRSSHFTYCQRVWLNPGVLAARGSPLSPPSPPSWTQDLPIPFSSPFFPCRFTY